jgi:hypothetical protein
MGRQEEMRLSKKEGKRAKRKRIAWANINGNRDK